MAVIQHRNAASDGAVEIDGVLTHDGFRPIEGEAEFLADLQQVRGIRVHSAEGRRLLAAFRRGTHPSQVTQE